MARGEVGSLGVERQQLCQIDVLIVIVTLISMLVFLSLCSIAVYHPMICFLGISSYLRA